MDELDGESTEVAAQGVGAGSQLQWEAARSRFA